MNAVVVYESHWGNTEAVAAGFGPEAEALTTDQASDVVLMDADLVVAGAPLIAFGLPSDKTRSGIAAESNKAPTPPDRSHPSLSSWLDNLRDGEIELARRWGAELAGLWQPERSVDGGSAHWDDRARSEEGPRR